MSEKARKRRAENGPKSTSDREQRLMEREKRQNSHAFSLMRAGVLVFLLFLWTTNHHHLFSTKESHVTLLTVKTRFDDFLKQHQRVLILYITPSDDGTTLELQNVLWNEFAEQAKLSDLAVVVALLNCDEKGAERLCPKEGLTKENLPLVRWYYQGEHQRLLDISFARRDNKESNTIVVDLIKYVQRNVETGELTSATLEPYLQSHERVFALFVFPSLPSLSFPVSLFPSNDLQQQKQVGILSIWREFSALVQQTESLESVKVVTFACESMHNHCHGGMDRFPSIRWYHHGRFYRLEYEEERSAEAFLQYALHKVDVELVTLTNTTAEGFLHQHDERALVYFYSNRPLVTDCDPQMITILDEVAEDVSRGKQLLSVPVAMALVDCDASRAVCIQHGVPNGICPVQWIRRGQALAPAKVESVQRRNIGRHEQIIEFAQKQIELELQEDVKQPRPLVLTAENWTFVLQQQPRLFVRVDLAAETTATTTATWNKLARRVHMDNDLNVAIAKAVCQNASSMVVCTFQDVLEQQASGLPTLYRWYKKGVYVPTTPMQSQRGSLVTEDVLLAYVKKMDESEPLELTPATWNITLSRYEYVFCVFFFPFCHYFRRMAPAWNAFATRAKDLPGLRLAKLDCTNTDFCTHQSPRILSSPSFRWYHRGTHVTPDYGGNRTVESFLGYARQKLDEA